MLTFDSNACIRSLVQRLIQVMDSLMSEFYRDATYGMSADGKADSEFMKAVYNQTEEMIEAKCKFYAQAIMESFGVGSQADTSAESYWAEYTSNPSFNNARSRSNPMIVGREQGTYIDIWGHTRGSSGRNRGKILEGVDLIDYNTGKTRMVAPMLPTRTIQNAEAWIHRDTETKVERRIKMEVEKFFEEEGSKFFIETGG